MLKIGQKHGCPDLWKESGGEDKLVEEFSAFENLPKKICQSDPMWEGLANVIFNDKTVQKKKWLYTVWHSDRKFVRTRAMLRKSGKKLSKFQQVKDRHRGKAIGESDVERQSVNNTGEKKTVTMSDDMYQSMSTDPLNVMVNVVELITAKNIEGCAGGPSVRKGADTSSNTGVTKAEENNHHRETGNVQ